ncbi:MAG: 23S rRNA (pseudouridine(1915)-N(3))-methyltransferase RlmH [bacterium]
MIITIIAIGKIKETFHKEAIDEFLKRLKPYHQIKIKELNAELLKNPNDVQKYIANEGEKILENIPQNAFVITLDSTGKSLTSEDFAQKFNLITQEGFNHLVFIIGGAYGLADEVKQRADFLLSFSKMTFTHQMIRIFLLEQIYRAIKILNGEPYHK